MSIAVRSVPRTVILAILLIITAVRCSNDVAEDTPVQIDVPSSSTPPEDTHHPSADGKRP